MVDEGDPLAQPSFAGDASAWPQLVAWTSTTPTAYQIPGAHSVGLVRSLSTTEDAYRFECRFVINAAGQVAFQLGAESRSATGEVLVAAEPRTPVALVGCADCETEPPAIAGSVVEPASGGGVHAVPVTFELTATDLTGPVDALDPRRALPARGIQRVYWQWIRGPLAAYDPNFAACPAYPGTTIQCAEAEATSEGEYAPSFAVLLQIDPLDAAGYNVIEFWAMDGAGNVSARGRQSLAFDAEPPYPLFAFPPPSGPCWYDEQEGVNHCWYNRPLSVPVNLFDNMTRSSEIVASGAAMPLVFSAEGENPPLEIVLTDAAGLSAAYSSADGYYNGRIVHIDSVPPTTRITPAGGSTPALLQRVRLTASDDGAGVHKTFYALSHGGTTGAAIEYQGGDIVLSGAGEWTVIFWSTDAAGNVEPQRRATFSLGAVNRPPVCDRATGGEIWPPNPRRFVAAAPAGVSDPDGDRVSVRIVSVMQDEPVDSTGDGRFAPDALIADGALWLRAERDSGGDGRVYAVTFEASDDRGGRCAGTVLWTVPKSRGDGGAAVDSGPRYDSLAGGGPLSPRGK
jgi:hypothetical protein